MPEPLPPDLDRLGQSLTKAATRDAAIRRARRMLLARVGACLAAAVLVLAATSPGRLGHADLASGIPDSGGVAFTSAVGGTLAVGCDRPHGAVGQRDGAPQDCAILRPHPQAL